MMKYGVEITDEFAVELDVPPNAPPVSSVTLTFDVAEDEFAAALEQLGGARQFMLNPSNSYQMRVGVPLTREGEKAGRATVILRLPAVEEAEADLYPVVRAAMKDHAEVARA
jgi:hypothetical protein